MAQIKRFGYGLQALLVLASDSEQITSAEIAKRIHLEPTALRKIMSMLVEACIVEVKQGRSGGYQLLRKPEQIPLSQVYKAVYEKEPIMDGMLETAGSHLLEGRVRQSFEGIMADMSRQVELVLSRYTIADLLDG